MSSSGGPPGASAASAGQSVYQEQLNNFCRTHGMSPPVWQVMSDRRGGRTAWSCVVRVDGLQTVQARFWYDGQYVNSAKEDAAQVALQRLGQLPQTGVQQTNNLQQQQQQPPQPQSPQQQQQQQQQQQGPPRGTRRAP